MVRIAMVTTARSDWGIQRCVAESLRDRDDVCLSIIAGGMHLAPEFGRTVSQIKADGFDVAAELDYLVRGDQSLDIAESMGRGVSAFAHQFAADRPDILLVLGDRFDMFPAAVAATPFQIAVAHIHGGEITQGAFDENLRHAITKMSHIHFASTQESRRRIIQMGERPEHVHHVGAPGLDAIASFVPVDAATLKREYGFVTGQTNVLVVYHPETRSESEPACDVQEIFRAVAATDAKLVNIVIVQPNADTGNTGIQNAIESFCRERSDVRVFASIPRNHFLSLMHTASVMLGNSSSGIIEAPSFGIPVVNVGERQRGRVRAKNVIDVEPMSHAIRKAVRSALSLDFVASLDGMQNPYGDGQSAPRIADILANTRVNRQLLAKAFVDQPVSLPHNFASSTNTRTDDSISSRHAHSIGE